MEKSNGKSRFNHHCLLAPIAHVPAGQGELLNKIGSTRAVFLS